MDKFSQIQVFCRIVELGTFAAAAKEMNISTMMVSKHIAQLEASLGVALLNRTTRSLNLTHAGEIYYSKSKPLLDDLAELEDMTAQLGECVKGQLKISAPIDFGGMYLVPAIEQYLNKYPEVKVLMTLDNKPPNLRGGNVDVSILVTDALDPGVVARKITTTKLGTYASPNYLSAHGTPKHIDDLHRHRCLHYVDTPHGDYWLFHDQGQPKKIKTDWLFASNNGRALCQAAALGMGIVQTPRLSVKSYLQSGELVEILQDFRVPSLEIYATYLQKRFYPARLTTFVDALIQYFEQQAFIKNA